MTDIADRFRHLAADLSDTVESVPADRWDRPSPCEGWTALDVLAHVAATEVEFLARFDMARPDPLPDDARAAWTMARDAMQAALDDPERATTAYDGWFGPTTFEATADQFYASDLLVHRWDIARATGLGEHEVMDPAEVSKVYADMLTLGDNLRAPGAFGPAVEVGDDASEQDRLLGHLGRHP